MKLQRRARRAVLVVHVAASACWLGVTLGLFGLSVTAVGSGSPEVAEASYRSMKVFSDWLVIPLALGTLLSGLLLSLGTRWGLARHWWVYLKFWLTLITTGLSILLLRPGINEAAAQASSGETVTSAGNLLVAPGVSLSVYLFMTAISVLKPWGLTRRGRKLRSADRKAVDAGNLRRTT
ncbi:DUF2269 domain-containing protein [Streptomyces sp. NPDC058045]|uniref:DUF2269 domain-containing protein n=1 Tax=Streptomyces sp. NPDC058045 TaxID=3346311 RepID=UPI0036E5E736